MKLSPLEIRSPLAFSLLASMVSGKKGEATAWDRGDSRGRSEKGDEKLRTGNSADLSIRREDRVMSLLAAGGAEKRNDLFRVHRAQVERSRTHSVLAKETTPLGRGNLSGKQQKRRTWISWKRTNSEPTVLIG